MSNTVMHGSRYWNDDEGWDYEYAFLVPPDTIDGNYTGKIHNVLKKFDKTLYVRSKNSPSDGWEKVQNTEEMPELETNRAKNGWTLSSDKYILSDNGVLDELEKNLKEAGCSCSFMVIEGGPEEEIAGASDMNFETKDPRQTTLNKTPEKTVEDKENSGEKKKKPKPKKSTNVKVRNGPQSKTIHKLKDRMKSEKASQNRNLISYKVVSDENNSKDNVKQAWIQIGAFIKNNADTYNDVKPIGYGNRKHWHNWHKSWVGKVFVQEDGRKFWLMKLNDDLKDKLDKDLGQFDFTIESYNDGNSKGETPTISTNPKPANMKVNSSRETEKETEQKYMQEEHTNKTKPKDNLHSANPGTTQHTIPQPPLKIAKTDHLPNELNQNQNTNPSVSPITAPSLAEQLQQKRHKLRPTENNKNENKPKKQASEADMVVGMQGVMKKRNKDREENTESGDLEHPIARLLTSRGNCKFILGLQLDKPRNKVLEAMGAVDLNDEKLHAKLLKGIQDNEGLSINDWVEDVSEYEKKMIGKNTGELGWILLIDSDSAGSVPTATELDALKTMSEKIKELGITLVKLNSDGTIAGSTPPRNKESNPVTSASETLDSKNTNELTQNQQYGPSLKDKDTPDLVVPKSQKPKSLPDEPNTEAKKNANANKVTDSEVQDELRTVVNNRRKGIRDPKAEGDPRHPIMDVLTKRGESMYIAKLQLMKPYGKIKEKLSAEALCPDCDGEIWLAPSEDDEFDCGRYIGDAISEEIMKQCAIPTAGKEPQEWYIKVCSEVEEENQDNDFLPSVRQQEQLSKMQDNLPSKSARLVSISTPLPKLKTQVKNPPPLPTRKVKPAPIPKGFATLDSLKPKPNNRNVKTLVLVKYEDISTSKDLLLDLRKKLKRSTRKYEAFNVDKATNALSAFGKGTLIGAKGQKTDKNYRAVLENPVVDKYKDDTLYSVKLWNLEIPADTSEDEIKTLRDELAKCGIAIRKDWRKSKV